MKIGIITLSASYNCGSLLQSYALKTVLSEYGEVEIINFSSKASHKQYSYIPSSLLKRIKISLRHSGIIGKLKNEMEAYQRFQRDYLCISGKEYFADELSEISEKYDVVVTGSDQVWNVVMSDFDEAFFCNWTNAKKIAYAPSLGGHDIRESINCDRIIDALKKIDRLSVREAVGKNCLDEIMNTDVVKVLDPTLLVKQEKWIQIAGTPKIQGDYIFFYSWAYCYDELREVVRKRAEETGLPVYVIDSHKWKMHPCERDGFILFEEAGPAAFLNLMANAKECYVESFHGMIFAYIFRRDFWLLDVHENYDELDARLKELVELFGGRERVVTKYNYDKVDFSVRFRYEKNTTVEKMKEVSFKYIEESFA